MRRFGNSWTLAAPIALGIVIALVGCAPSESSSITQAYQDLSYENVEEQGQREADCVEESTGFILDVGRDGSLGVSSENVPEAQWSLVFQEMDRCEGSSPSDLPLQFSNEDIGRLFDLQLVARECFVKEGYAISEPPSGATFIDSFQAGDKLWNLGMELALIHKLGPDEQMDLKEKCPDPLDFLTELSENGAK